MVGDYRDSTGIKEFILFVTDLGLIPGSALVPQAPPGLNSGPRAGITPEPQIPRHKKEVYD